MAHAVIDTDVTLGSTDELEAYLLTQLQGEDGQHLTGVEWERNTQKKGDTLINVDDMNALFRFMADLYTQHGRTVTHKDTIQYNNINYLRAFSVKDAGTIVQDSGLQTEFAGLPYDLSSAAGLNAMRTELETFDTTLREAAATCGQGLVISDSPFVVRNSAVQPLPSARGSLIADFAAASFCANDARRFLNGSRGAASFQVTVGLGGEQAFEGAKALLLSDLLLGIRETRTARNRAWFGTRTNLVPQTVKPIVGVWSARDNRDAARAIKSRFLDMPVIALPDATGAWQPLFSDKNPAPTFAQLLTTGQVSATVVENLRKNLHCPGSPRGRTPPSPTNPFGKMLFEARAIDSVRNATDGVAIAQRISKAVYDSSTRKDLLDKAFAHFGEQDIDNIYYLLAHHSRSTALDSYLPSGKKLRHYVDLFEEITRPEIQTANIGQSLPAIA